MSSKITIIGAGSVGATIAYTLSSEDIASEIVLIDINKEKVEGEVMDIAQGTCFRNPISIKAGEYEDAKDSDVYKRQVTVGVTAVANPTQVEAATKKGFQKINGKQYYILQSGAKAKGWLTLKQDGKQKKYYRCV